MTTVQKEHLCPTNRPLQWLIKVAVPGQAVTSLVRDVIMTKWKHRNATSTCQNIEKSKIEKAITCVTQ